MAKQLTKSLSDKKLTGVCGGIAEYFNIDPIIIRIAFIILVFGYGVGLLAYILLAILLPAK
ncbi:MAG: PspC domain-containing protein [Bacteroidales bacterium]|nr:PspC domain-containing protein [Bacteroidales bacterium]